MGPVHTSPEYIKASISLRSSVGMSFGISKTGCCHPGKGFNIDWSWVEQAEMTTLCAENCSPFVLTRVTSQNVSSDLRWSTCVLLCFSWLLDHVIYIKLSKFTKWQLKMVLDEESCHFWVKIVDILWICSALQRLIFFLILR